jgi:hypothetical protein
MAISPRTEKILWGKAGATCSLLGCRRELVAEASKADGEVVLGEVAHIAARNRDGPRGEFLPPGGDIDGYENLILVCEEHHKLIDGQPNTYTVAKLGQIKEDHERWVKEQLSREKRFLQAYRPPEDLQTEAVYSNLLPVNHIPMHIYSAPCNLSVAEVKENILSPNDREIMLPFILKGRQLISFYDLRQQNNPFYNVIDSNAVVSACAPTWWEDPDRYRWFIELLNRSLNKLTGRKGLNFDKEHSRYYFEPTQDGKHRSIVYTSLAKRKTTRQVAWRSSFKHSGELKNYWEHLAVGLRFHWVSQSEWCLSIRPERRFTRDGYTPLTPKGTGRRSTSRKARMRNIDVFQEVNFWRDFLSGGSPRIIFNFGSQSLIVNTDILKADISWPGVPEDSKPLEDLRYEDDLFTYADYQTALSGKSIVLEELAED